MFDICAQSFKRNMPKQCHILFHTEYWASKKPILKDKLCAVIYATVGCCPFIHYQGIKT